MTGCLSVLTASCSCRLPPALPRSRRRRAGRDDPEFGRAGLALSAVNDDDARGVYAARGREVRLRAVAALLARAVARAPSAVRDGVALRARPVLQLGRHGVAPCLRV